MELATFISETIKGIIKGVKDSQEFAKKNHAKVNPNLERNNISDRRVSFNDKKDGARSVSDIQFDIAVTVSNKKENGVGGEIKIFSVELGGKKSTNENNEIVSRIKFEVPIVLPDIDPSS